MALPFKLETPEERARRLQLKAASLTPQAEGKAAYPTTIVPPDIQPTMRAMEPVPPAPVQPAIDPALLAAVRPAHTVDPELEPIYARHAAERASRGLGPEAPLGDVATTDQDPTVVYEKGRPVSATGPDQLEAQKALQKSTNEYIPQKAPKWIRILAPLLQAAGVVGGITSGDSRAAAQNAQGLTRSLVNPRYADELWKQGRQAEVGGQIDDLYKQQDRAADTAYRAAQTKKLGEKTVTPVRGLVQTDGDGYLVLVDPTSGKKINVVDSKTGDRVKGRQSATAVRREVHIDEETGKAWVFENGKRTEMRAPEADRIIEPGYGPLPPGTKYATDRQFGTQDRALNIENQKAEAENALIQANIKSIEERRAKVASALKDTAKEVDDLDSYGTKIGMKANPRYRALEVEDIQLDEELRRARASLKPIVKAPPRPTVTSGRAKIPAKTNHALQLKELEIQ